LNLLPLNIILSIHPSIIYLSVIIYLYLPIYLGIFCHCPLSDKEILFLWEWKSTEFCHCLALTCMIGGFHWLICTCRVNFAPQHKLAWLWRITPLPFQSLLKVDILWPQVTCGKCTATQGLSSSLLSVVILRVSYIPHRAMF
jgi:hypothetical protein